MDVKEDGSEFISLTEKNGSRSRVNTRFYLYGSYNKDTHKMYMTARVEESLMPTLNWKPGDIIDFGLKKVDEHQVRHALVKSSNGNPIRRPSPDSRFFAVSISTPQDIVEKLMGTTRKNKRVEPKYIISAGTILFEVEE